MGWLTDNRRFAWTVFIITALVFSLYGIQRVNVCLSAGYDLGIFDQAIGRMAHFQQPIVTLKGDDYDIRADHFHPILALWVPLYWIWDNIRVLCIGQGLVVAATVFPLWRFARRHFTSSRWAKLFALAVTLFWPIQSLIDYEVHEIAFAVPLLALVVDALDRRDDLTLVICSGLLLCVREDMGVVVFMVGLVRLVWSARRIAATAAATAVLGRGSSDTTLVTRAIDGGGA
ncbi:MAG: DUF2079 domain-containing protein, partial [Propionibacteriaceae bacterium]|nr:DUF2079 domain-containing protein [Propionibacteriaceae bacterium]